MCGAEFAAAGLPVIGPVRFSLTEGGPAKGFSL